MKKYVRASQYNSYFTIQHGHKKFSVHINTDGPYPGSFAAQVSEIHPYDDANYAWAKVDFNGQVKFIQDGKIIDKMQLPTYEEDDYESITDYADDMLDSVAVELSNINKSVDPRMIYN